MQERRHIRFAGVLPIGGRSNKLRRTRALLTAKGNQCTLHPEPLRRSAVVEKENKVKGFRDFLLRGNVVDLAVAVVIGLAFSAIVTALVKDLITPLIAAIGGKPDFSALNFTVNHSRFLYGDFINAVVAFLIIAAVVYFLVVLPYTRVMERIRPTPRPTPRRDCPFCASSIPEVATRCPFCTSQLTAPAEALPGGGKTTAGAAT